MCNETGNLVTKTLGWDDGNFFADSLVCMEIHTQTGIIFLDNHTRSFLNGFGTNATLLRNICDKKYSWISEIFIWNLPFLLSFSTVFYLVFTTAVGKGTKVPRDWEHENNNSATKVGPFIDSVTFVYFYFSLAGREAFVLILDRSVFVLTSNLEFRFKIFIFFLEFHKNILQQCLRSENWSPILWQW